MVISDDHKFIFLRVPKNASTSLATFFVNGYCHSNKDIYTSIGDSKVQNKNIPSSVLHDYRKQHRFIHLTLNEIINNKIITEQYARSCKIIGCLRDPLDRQLSLYFFKNRGRGNPSPEEFRREFKNGYSLSDENNQIRQCDYLKIGDQSVGEWWLYDDLNTHLEEFQKQYSSSKNVELKTYKSSFRKKVDKQEQIDYYYNEEVKNAVLNYYAEDADLYQRLKSVRS